MTISTSAKTITQVQQSIYDKAIKNRNSKTFFKLVNMLNGKISYLE